MEFKMDTPNQFRNGNMRITVGVTLHGSESYIFLKSKRQSDTAENRYIDMNRSQALQLARAIEVVAESLP